MRTTKVHASYSINNPELGLSSRAAKLRAPEHAPAVPEWQRLGYPDRESWMYIEQDPFLSELEIWSDGELDELDAA